MQMTPSLFRPLLDPNVYYQLWSRSGVPWKQGLKVCLKCLVITYGRFMSLLLYKCMHAHMHKYVKSSLVTYTCVLLCPNRACSHGGRHIGHTGHMYSPWSPLGLCLASLSGPVPWSWKEALCGHGAWPVHISWVHLLFRKYLQVIFEFWNVSASNIWLKEGTLLSHYGLHAPCAHSFFQQKMTTGR